MIDATDAPAASTRRSRWSRIRRVQSWLIASVLVGLWVAALAVPNDTVDGFLLLASFPLVLWLIARLVLAIVRRLRRPGTGRGQSEPVWDPAAHGSFLVSHDADPAIGRARDPSFVESPAAEEADAESDEWLEIDASDEAARYIREHGGRLFVWFKNVSAEYVVQKVTTSAPPAGPLFDEYNAGDFTLLLDSEFDPPPTIRIRFRRWWPFRPLVVSGIGSGAVVNPLGGGDGGRSSWPSTHGHGGLGGYGGHGGHGGGHGGHGGHGG